MITDSAFDELQDTLYDLISYIAIGTGTTPATAADTALGTEVYPDGANREALSSKTKVGNRKTAYIININKTKFMINTSSWSTKIVIIPIGFDSYFFGRIKLI